jgi:hypothetical protein
LHDDLLLQVLAHLFAGNADQRGLKLEAARGLEGDVDLHLALGIDNALLVVEFEALIQDFLNLSRLDLAHILVACLHHQLNVQVAVALVGDHD